MGCRAIHMWTLSGLVGAFLDLAIAYFLLCASAISYLAAKFLGFFGLCLPCPCNGLFFAAPNSNHCLQRLLVDFPTQTVSNVQHSMKQKFPFNDSISENNQNGKVINENVKGILEIEGEASCSSLSDARRSRNVPRRQLNLRKDRSDMKGKRVVNYTRKGGFRLRKRRKGSVDGGNYSLVSSYDPSLCGEQDGAVPMSPYSIDKIGNEFSGGISLPLDNEDATHNIECCHDIISLRNAYHGNEAGTMAATALCNWKFILVQSGVHHAMNPDPYRGIFGSDGEMYAKDVQDLIQFGTCGHVAAFISEAIQGVAGIVELAPGYLPAVYSIIRNAGGLCIADEIDRVISIF
ncbi:Aminotransferase class-III [Olea europaea subsp. europaea]|uniref:Aminotransferase class-III n=1 Tax=Olea europaea subsp. europaea TaxID=158383 RepID=A0A8S0R4N0_OLEEU|nr:Aminotransferase class-III [Olea europaea subsp. europaea]